MRKKNLKLGKNNAVQPLVGIVMGSQSDWATMEFSASILAEFGIGFETSIVSAHRTPGRLFTYASTAVARGLKIIIAGAGGAAHLPGMIASLTSLPVLGVPMVTRALDGMDSLLSIAQMPAGVPVGTLAIGPPGATNAGLLAVSILSLGDDGLRESLERWRARQTASIAASPNGKGHNRKK